MQTHTDENRIQDKQTDISIKEIKKEQKEKSGSDMIEMRGIVGCENKEARFS